MEVNVKESEDEKENFEAILDKYKEKFGAINSPEATE